MKAKAKAKAGGIRPGAGRKELPVKKTEVTLKILPDKIESAGGRKAFYATVYDLIEKHI